MTFSPNYFVSSLLWDIALAYPEKDRQQVVNYIKTPRHLPYLPFKTIINGETIDW